MYQSLNGRTYSTQTLKHYMLSNYQDHVDPLTGIVNTTALTEDTADHFNLYLNDTTYDIDEELYDLALKVEDVLVKKGLVEPLI